VKQNHFIIIGLQTKFYQTVYLQLDDTTCMFIQI